MTPRFNADRQMEPPAGASRREIPILFHLRDVRQSRPAVVAEAVPSDVPVVGEVNSQPSNAIAAVTVVESAPAAQALADAAQAIETPHVTVEPDAVPPEHPVAEVASADVKTEITAPSGAPTPNAVAPSAGRHNRHKRRHKPHAKQDNWFSSQGKYIAIGFALALLGTVIHSTVTRPSRSGTESQSAMHNFPGDAGLTEVQSSPASATATATATSPSTVAFVGATSEVNSVKSGEAATVGAEPKTELHAPVVAQIANAAPTANQAKTDESLFPWAKKADERVATREPSPAFIENPAVSNDHSQGALQSPLAAASAPPAAPPLPQSAAELAYPTTAPRNSYQAAPSPPIAGRQYSEVPQSPNSTYRSAYVPAGGTPQAASIPNTTAGAATQQFPTPDNTARGPRYDRTGQGIY